jgi:murein tripeptide amidase MpaA
MTEYFTYGKSIEGRTLYGLRIFSPGTHNPSKPTLSIVANAHAREWISTMTSQFIMANLLEGYAKNPEVKNILDKLNVYIIFMLNPDGYHYSCTKSRLWRKNRNPNSGKYYGVDLNRNFGTGYGIGASSSESSETYKGKFAYSEPEVKAVDDFFKNNRQIVGGLDLHSYSQLILRAYSYKSAASPDEAQLKKMGAEMQEAIKSVHKETYQNIRGIELYPAGGVCEHFVNISFIH